MKSRAADKGSVPPYSAALLLSAALRVKKSDRWKVFKGNLISWRLEVYNIALAMIIRSVKKI